MSLHLCDIDCKEDCPGKVADAKMKQVSRGALICFLTGTFFGFLVGFHSRFITTLPSFFQKTKSFNPILSKTLPLCKVCQEDLYHHVREPVQFLGPLYGDWLSQYDKCMSRPMRYQFSLNGTIGISGKSPSQEGNPDTTPLHTAAPSQVYAPLSSSRKDLFGARNGTSYVWSKELLDYLISEVVAGKDISCNDYPQSATDVGYALELLNVGPNDRLLVGGSISPWVEAIALHQGAGHVTTVDYNVPYCDGCHERLETIHMNTLMLKSTPAEYSHIISYSSIEHDGLGRYGDPLNPYGDLEAMREFWSLLRVGGILLLAVPMWEKDQLAQLLARLYGPIRLPWLVRGWEYLGCVNRGVWSTKVPLHRSNNWGWHPIVALRKTAEVMPSTSSCTLDCTNSSLPENKLHDYNACRPSRDCGDVSRHWPLLQKRHIRGNEKSNADDYFILNQTATP